MGARSYALYSVCPQLCFFLFPQWFAVFMLCLAVNYALHKIQPSWYQIPDNQFIYPDDEDETRPPSYDSIYPRPPPYPAERADDVDFNIMRAIALSRQNSTTTDGDTDGAHAPSSSRPQSPLGPQMGEGRSSPPPPYSGPQNDQGATASQPEQVTEGATQSSGQPDNQSPRRPLVLP